MSKLFESSAAGAFMYAWGYQDAKNKVKRSPGILLNAQNPLDNLVGDVFGAVRPGQKKDPCRYFIAELKREYSGFHDEVHSKGAKPHRTALYQHLRADKACRKLARFGHIAIWADTNGFNAAHYADAVGPGAKGGPPPKIDELDCSAWTISFRKLYNALNEKRLKLYKKVDPILYKHGLGLSGDAMRIYLTCMMQYSVPLPTKAAIVDEATSDLIFGCVGPDKSVLAIGSFEGLLAACDRYVKTLSQEKIPRKPKP